MKRQFTEWDKTFANHVSDQGLISKIQKDIQLTQYTSTIELAIRDVDSSIKILKYPPKWIKKYVGAGGTAAKDDMLSNLQTIPVINNLLPLNKLSEHEIDATSIAYVLYNDILVQPWLLYMLQIKKGGTCLTLLKHYLNLSQILFLKK